MITENEYSNKSYKLSFINLLINFIILFVSFLGFANKFEPNFILLYSMQTALVISAGLGFYFSLKSISEPNSYKKIIGLFINFIALIHLILFVTQFFNNN